MLNYRTCGARLHEYDSLRKGEIGSKPLGTTNSRNVDRFGFSPFVLRIILPLISALLRPQGDIEVFQSSTAIDSIAPVPFSLAHRTIAADLPSTLFRTLTIQLRCDPR